VEILLAFLFVLGICSLLLVAWAIWRMSRMQEALSEALATVVTATTAADGNRTKLLDKSIALLSVKDPLAYQAVQVMEQATSYNQPYDPSDEADLERLRIMHQEGDVDGPSDGPTVEQEREFLAQLGVPGADL
jgi:uncharacterized membrane protein YccC